MESIIKDLENKDIKIVEESIVKLNKLAIKKEVDIENIAAIFLNIDNILNLEGKQRETAKFGIIKFFDMNYEYLEEKEEIIEFTQKETGSPSPKTRRRAKASKLKEYFRY